MENLILIFVSISLLAYLLSCFFTSKVDHPQAGKLRLFSKIGLVFLFLGLLGNLYLIVRHFYQIKRMPLTNTSETLLSLITLIIIVYLVLECKIRLPKVTAVVVSLISLLGLYLAFYILKRPPMPLLPALQSKWLVFHVSSCIIAYTFFTIAFITSLVYFFRKDKGLSILAIMHRCICIGFLFLTLGIILGSVWGKSAWGHWWNWDPKETWALITWLIYAGYIHARILGNWSEKKMVTIAILGFLACLFTYLGVNYLLKGLHSYG